MEFKMIPLHVENAFVIEHHRHHGPVVGHKFSIAAYDNGRLCGVAIVGRPVGRKLDDGKTLEVTRLCTDGTRNACSFLYSTAARISKKKGYKKIITYILQSESGASLKASNWILEKSKAGGLSWSNNRYKGKQEQLSFFEKKIPPREYKQRWCRLL